MTHNEVVDALTAWLTARRANNMRQFFVGNELNLGSAMHRGGVPRVDVLTVAPSYKKFCVAIYECKASRADFLSDVNEGKWRKYLPYCHRLYFAAPADIIKADELPAEVGLLALNDKGDWRWQRQSKPRDDITFNQEILVSLLITCANHTRRSIQSPVERLSAFEYLAKRNKAAAFGKVLGNRIARLDMLEAECKRVVDAHSSALQEITTALGIDVTNKTPQALANEIKNHVRGRLSEDNSQCLRGIAHYLQLVMNPRSTAQTANYRPRVPRVLGWDAEVPDEEPDEEDL